MRGKPRRDRDRRLHRGLIPAHAGKTFVSNGEIPKGRAHPRSFGENSGLCVRRVASGGSSPLMQGKPTLSDRIQTGSGLIPAHAGKTWSATERCPSRTAHPRSCGENFPKRFSKPPHGGLIPAHAGKTTSRICTRLRMWAHPRSCGENSSLHAPICCAKGSSPLMRGKRRGTGSEVRVDGLIPAHAGKTASFTGQPARSWAHPRSCGENVSRT